MAKPKSINDDRRLLRQEFYAAYDGTHIADFCRRLNREPVTRRPDAQGAHFKVYKIEESGRLPLALKIAKPEFGKDDEAPGRIRKWLECIRLLKDSEGTLIPPLEIITADYLCMVMPYGDELIEKIKAHWQPLSAWISETNECLRSTGLIIDDLVQVCVWQGIPFIVDFSDLSLDPR